jgi:hypothetical protein
MELKEVGSSLLGMIGVLILGLLGGCSGGGDGGTGSNAQAGVVSVSLTDAPACGFDEVNVTVRQVWIHKSTDANDNDDGWTTITLDPPRRINLLDLNDPTQPNFALETLGEASLAAGHYTQLRLILERNTGQSPANSVVLTNDATKTEIPLDTPSAVQSGIKLIHQFTVGSGQHVDLLLDFDACHSIVKAGLSGKYILKPVIKVIPYVLNGIEGFVNTALLSKNVVVSAQGNNGEVFRTVVPNANTNTNSPDLLGKFFLAHLPEGQYNVVITADDHATAVIAGVPVGETSRTVISTKDAPFSLVTSTPTRTIGGTVTLGPATDDVAVIVAAKQSLNPGPTVTVKSRPTALVAGDPPGDSTYTLDQLPPGAPSLGTYDGTLPIILSAAGQAAVAGQYAIQASATGYATQTPSPLSVNVAGGDQPNQNLALTP